MQKLEIIIAEVLLCNILNVWFQKHFIHAFFVQETKMFRIFFLPWFKESAGLSKNLAKNVVVIWCMTAWSNVVHNLVRSELKIKKWWRRGGGGEFQGTIPPLTYLTSKKPNFCRVKKYEKYSCTLPTISIPEDIWCKMIL